MYTFPIYRQNKLIHQWIIVNAIYIFVRENKACKENLDLDKHGKTALDMSSSILACAIHLHLKLQGHNGLIKIIINK